MEQLSDVDWDVLISGTGLPQSILALALSRSGKNVLHIDKNGYYGGPDAAFSLQEAEDWVTKINEAPDSTPFESASISTLPASSEDEGSSKLLPSRAYTLSLSPQLIYSRSRLIPNLVSSRIYRQLEFLPVGSWWVCRYGDSVSSSLITRVPGSREDIFADDNMSNKSKRSLMKFLRYLAQTSVDDGNEAGEEDSDLNLPFAKYLMSNFHIPSDLHDPLTSLSLSSRPWDETSTRYAVPRIRRHLGSIGVFGAGFGALLPKWGGGPEISQVGCRACAVGGGVYVLNKGIRHVEVPTPGPQNGGDDRGLLVQLSDGETVRSKFVVGSPWDLPAETQRSKPTCTKISRSIMVVSSSLQSLFPPTSEGGPIPAGAVVFVPGPFGTRQPPIYLIVHSSDTGECPTGQCVIYGSKLLTDNDDGESLIQSAATNFLTSVDPEAKILWSLRYTQSGVLDEETSLSPSAELSPVSDSFSGRVFSFAPPNLDLSFDDGMLEQVRAVWEAVTEGDAERGEFLQFEDREGTGGEDGDGEEAGLN
ncbi:rab geranylgeranyl transferase escort protein [Blastomyces dermatitidis ATCC 18188]|uniref:Rab proteins geranylgeranyltransferase n=1 Tax=Ajellomyces dermatitidis (strain ATCC 18188 / CBS 674.68) TaxID=653446 RepID=F2TLR3_AJEDA|nr:rab geranylgeranyl transferase escort protein [Blastomyces dermatitidis ATCC 18188]